LGLLMSTVVCYETLAINEGGASQTGSVRLLGTHLSLHCANIGYFVVKSFTILYWHFCGLLAEETKKTLEILIRVLIMLVFRHIW